MTAVGEFADEVVNTDVAAFVGGTLGGARLLHTPSFRETPSSALMAEADLDQSEVFTSAYAEAAPLLASLGYAPIPIVWGQKYPAFKGWQNAGRNPPSSHEIAEIAKGRHRYGAGIATGTIVNGEQVLAIDIDLEGDDLERAIASLPFTPMMKIGRKGATLFYLGDPDWPSCVYRNGKTVMVDFLANKKQTVVPPSIHPDTQRSYIWVRGPVAASKLPPLPLPDRERFVDTLRHLGCDSEADFSVPAHAEANDNETDREETVQEEVNRRALNDLQSWVPALGLHKLRRSGERYEAVPVWRVSNSGKPAEERKRSVKIHPRGIKDMGAGQGFSPIGLVRQALDLPDTKEGVDDAFRWLADQTGYSAELDLIPIEFLAAMEEKTRLKAEARLAAIAEREAESVALSANKLIRATPYRWEEPFSVPRRQWVFGNFAIRQEIALTVAPGGVGKTALGLVEGVSMATGRNLLNVPLQMPQRVWVWNGEEPPDEMRRRLAAITSHYGISEDDLGGRLFVDTEDGVELVLAEESRGGRVIRIPVVEALIEELREREIDVMIIDPFVSTHTMTENDNNSMQMAASAWKRVAKGANVAVLLAHHTRKSGGQRVTSDSSRGGDALVSKARSVRALNPMTDNEAKKFSIDYDEQSSIFSIDPGDGKVNMVSRAGSRQWFKNVSVPLYNQTRGNLDLGDEIGVVEPWTPPDPVVEELDPNAVLALQRKLATGFWYAAPQAHAKPFWVGFAVASAFGLNGDDWKDRAKTLWRILLANDEARVTIETSPDTRQKVKIARPPEGFGEPEIALNTSSEEQSD